MKNWESFSEEHSSVKHPLLKFEREVLKTITMAVSLQKELDEHKNQIGEMINNFSAKLENNGKLSFFIERYLKIYKTYNVAYKEFLQACPDLINDNSDISNLINDLTKSFDTISSDIAFKTDFEDAGLIFDNLNVTLFRIIQIGNNIRDKIREIFATAIRKRNTTFQIMHAILWLATVMCIFTLGYAIIKRQAVLQLALVTFGWMVFLFCVKRDEKKAKQNHRM